MHAHTAPHSYDDWNAYNYDQDGDTKRLKLGCNFQFLLHRFNPFITFILEVIRIVVMSKEIVCLLFNCCSSYNSAALHWGLCTYIMWCTEALKLLIKWDTLSTDFPGDSFLKLPVSKPWTQTQGAERQYSTMGKNSGSAARWAQIPVLSLSAKWPWHFTIQASISLSGR